MLVFAGFMVLYRNIYGILIRRLNGALGYHVPHYYTVRYGSTLNSSSRFPDTNEITGQQQEDRILQR